MWGFVHEVNLFSRYTARYWSLPSACYLEERRGLARDLEGAPRDESAPMSAARGSQRRSSPMRWEISGGHAALDGLVLLPARPARQVASPLPISCPTAPPAPPRAAPLQRPRHHRRLTPRPRRPPCPGPFSCPSCPPPALLLRH